MTENKPVERETDLVLVRLKNGKTKKVTRALATNAKLKILTGDEANSGEVVRLSGDYASAKVGELKSEIVARNDDRNEDEQLSTEGSKADLVAILEADDQNEEATP